MNVFSALDDELVCEIERRPLFRRDDRNNPFATTFRLRAFDFR
jgi:hypothetical protein